MGRGVSLVALGLLRPRSRNFVKHAAASSQISPATEGSPDSTTFGNISIQIVGDLCQFVKINHYLQIGSSGS